jgi:hypothetical protein
VLRLRSQRVAVADGRSLPSKARPRRCSCSGRDAVSVSPDGSEPRRGATAGAPGESENNVRPCGDVPSYAGAGGGFGAVLVGASVGPAVGLRGASADLIRGRGETPLRFAVSGVTEASYGTVGGRQRAVSGFRSLPGASAVAPGSNRFLLAVIDGPPSRAPIFK